MSNFYPLEVVDRGSETQLQVVTNLNKFTQQYKGSHDLTQTDSVGRFSRLEIVNYIILFPDCGKTHNFHIFIMVVAK